MKRAVKLVVSFVLLTLILMMACSCFIIFETAQDKAKRMVGQYSKEEYYSSGGFQDYTDYAKYHYDKMPDFESNKYFSAITSSDIKALNGYIDNFEQWISVISPENEVVKNYDFDRSVITESDYFYIYDKMGEPIGESAYEQYDYYDVYVFDTESCILYYFHNNI